MAKSERAKSFVGTVVMANNAGQIRVEAADGEYRRQLMGTVVVVTPLLDGDPRPGEVWLLDGRKLEIASAPFPCYRGVGVALRDPRTGTMSWNPADSLRRPPVLKTFCLDMLNAGAETKYGVSATIRAESKEAALAKLAESLEEVR